MKPFSIFLKESLNQNVMFIFDIDDTIIHSKSKVGVRLTPNDEMNYYTSEEWSNIRGSIPKTAEIDWSGFHDTDKIVNGIIQADYIVPVLKILDYAVDIGANTGILTARANKPALIQSLSKKIRKQFDPNNIHTIGDDENLLRKPQEAKAEILKKYCQQYEMVYFLDDDDKNLEAARDMNLPNLVIIDAKEIEKENNKDDIIHIDNEGRITYANDSN
jgi:FMN phosphatase YigB (HAD superfamily)